MSLKETINNDIKTAMKAKDEAALRALRAIKSAILLAETAEGKAGAELSPDEEMKLLQKQAKQRKESIDQFKANNRDDLAKTEIEELEVIERYLPKQLSEAEIEARLKEIIAQAGASSAKDMGKVMGVATKALAGLADGKLVSEMVKRLLN